ncbi:MAG: hypothetical protein A2508_01680 [Candidatus Lambdaproteobacteria bacterium RIFOXYD12_FULL_49_8]|uniref:PTS EIIA type-4 domain-containing protein n=1 Tax=Candidatus Lambdaproteobacteria bacterium RIFOXYD2_FULL_50_16 TaxID=1817772 RepID=A0A1F6GGN1_9PROT|nr:MAG: hypothetical protein A2508_01680 [Candidatus Lambdaproteobacteria bacterium RIFOXYD12_FULL_49_8]OGG97257.1 MAG: hypothetical protein A2527_10505 [Candidatus Lambdaproteobacteria bacterium RIFOXYD2_FULL_50_16]
MEVSLLVITHGSLAQELVSVAQMMLERPLNVQAVCLALKGSNAKYAGQVNQAIKAIPEGNRVIALTDIFGGTPSNLLLPFLQKDRLEVITGVNLGLLIHLLSSKLEGSLSDICNSAKQAGQEAILVAGDFL